MATIKDMTGKKFGKWTVIKRGANSTQGQARWICVCACGCPKLVKGSHLRGGLSTQCKRCHDTTFNRRHGLYSVSTYKIWEALIQRCTNPKDAAYANYGGRGITVCEEWRQDFMNFWADMGERPVHLTLERINNNLGYNKANCRWASRQEQGSNRRDTHMPGTIFKNWKLIEKFPYSKHSKFQCINCGREWRCETFYVSSGKAAACKCTTQLSNS